MKAMNEIGSILATAFGMLVMGFALLIAAPAIALVALLCMAGVWRSHGGISPENMPRIDANEREEDCTVATLFGDSAGVFEAVNAELERQQKRTRRRLRRRTRWIAMRRALREVLLSKLAAVTAGVWIAWALVRAWEWMK